LLTLNRALTEEGQLSNKYQYINKGDTVLLRRIIALGNAVTVFIKKGVKETDLSNITCIHCDFAGVQLSNTNFNGSVLRNANFSKANCTACSFQNSDLNASLFNKTDLTNSNFSNPRPNPIAIGILRAMTLDKGDHYYQSPRFDSANLTNAIFSFFPLFNIFNQYRHSSYHIFNSSFRNANITNANFLNTYVIDISSKKKYPDLFQNAPITSSHSAVAFAVSADSSIFGWQLDDASRIRIAPGDFENFKREIRFMFQSTNFEKAKLPEAVASILRESAFNF
jgi:uncharacterized protein YjbI with pentapeptide repeats